MENKTTKIETRFTIGTEQGINALVFLSVAITKELFTGKIPDQDLEYYISANFSKDALMVEVNSMSNQYLVVYVDDEPAGYARVTSKGEHPRIFENKTLSKIANFGVLAKYNEPLVWKSLFEKCLSISTMYQVVLINEYEYNPYLAFFESYGFIRGIDIVMPTELPLVPVYFIKEKV